MLNSVEHEINPAHKCLNANNCVILTLISMVNTTYEGLKARNFFICRYFSFHEKVRTLLSWAWKKFYNLGPWLRNAYRYAMFT